MDGRKVGASLASDPMAGRRCYLKALGTAQACTAALAFTPRLMMLSILLMVIGRKSSLCWQPGRRKHRQNASQVCASQ